MDKHQMIGLQKVAKARLSALQVAFSDLSLKEARLRENLQQLVAKRQTLTERTAELDPARNAGADVRWFKWVEDRRAVINTELAQLAAKKLQLQQKMRRAFGKEQVFQDLIKRQTVTENQKRVRRSD